MAVHVTNRLRFAGNLTAPFSAVAALYQRAGVATLDDEEQMEGSVGNDEGGSSALARQFQISCISTILQLLLAVVFILASLWFASILLEWVRVFGITTVPPGIVFVEYDARA